MCGIVGYVGRDRAAPVLLDGLKRLEYRGYDSAGIVVFENGELTVAKTKGFVSELSNMIDGGNKIGGTVGLGHTRWATHGEPSDVNAHPHISFGGNIAVVHNGIIENYIELRDFLKAKGYEFKSETDTEVAVNLIQYFYGGDLLEAVSAATRRMEGSYALGIMCDDSPETLIAARKESPLILGKGDGFNLFASDVTAVIKHTREVYYMEDDEFAVLTAGSIKFYDIDLEAKEKCSSTVDWDVSAAEKGGYEHFMFKEIMEQPDAIRKTVSPRIKQGRVVFEGLSIEPEFIKKTSRIVVVACGSSYNVGVVAKYNIEKFARKPVEVVLASEFRYSSPLIDSESLVICISQSGTTADTIAALREARRHGAKILSIVNVVGSTIATESDDVLYTWAGPEIAVATTKAYSTQLAVMCLVTLYIADICGTISDSDYRKIIEEIETLPEKLQTILNNKEHIQYLASIFFNNDDIFFIGRNIDYALSLEGSLKLKEISYIHSEAYAAGELKHGAIALVENGTLVIAIASYSKLIEKTMSNAVEVKSRGARVLAITTESSRDFVEKTADETILIPDIHEMLLPSLAVVPMQLFAYYVALMRGCSIDKPKNLAKSVTVE